MLNVSSRGLGLSISAPPEPGTYVEIRRGRHIIVARVMWTEGVRCGLHTQDPISIDALIRESDSTETKPPPSTALEPRAERRRTLALSRQHDRSRLAGRALEFAFFGFLGASAALVGFDLVKETVGRPLTEVQTALIQ
jgi:hypothetical protein